MKKITAFILTILLIGSFATASFAKTTKYANDNGDKVIVVDKKVKKNKKKELVPVPEPSPYPFPLPYQTAPQNELAMFPILENLMALYNNRTIDNNTFYTEVNKVIYEQIIPGVEANPDRFDQMLAIVTNYVEGKIIIIDAAKYMAYWWEPSNQILITIYGRIDPTIDLTPVPEPSPVPTPEPTPEPIPEPSSYPIDNAPQNMEKLYPILEQIKVLANDYSVDTADYEIDINRIIDGQIIPTVEATSEQHWRMYALATQYAFGYIDIDTAAENMAYWWYPLTEEQLTPIPR